jgi:hypothetical protein
VATNISNIRREKEYSPHETTRSAATAARGLSSALALVALPVCTASVVMTPPAVAAPPEVSVRFPAWAGVLNVREAPYNARGDGRTDDTAAIQKALTAGLDKHRIVYLPDGIYLVRDTLRWRTRPRGRQRGRLGTFSPGAGTEPDTYRDPARRRLPRFTDPRMPKAVLQTVRAPGMAPSDTPMVKEMRRSRTTFAI